MSELYARVQSRLKGARLSLNTYVMRRGLGRMPVLVKRQRRLEAAVAKLEKRAKREKATREEIDALLVQAGLKHGEGVTCLGYDVVHWERDGAEKIDETRLQIAGVAQIDIDFAKVRGKAAAFATVRPMKGAQVAA